MTDEGRDRHGWGDKGLNGEWKRRKDRRLSDRAKDSVSLMPSVVHFVFHFPLHSSSLPSGPVADRGPFGPVSRRGRMGVGEESTEGTGETQMMIKTGE